LFPCQSCEKKKTAHADPCDDHQQLYGLYKTSLNDPHFSAVEGKKPWAMDIVSYQHIHHHHHCPDAPFRDIIPLSEEG
jgi:hypothetical protein